MCSTAEARLPLLAIPSSLQRVTSLHCRRLRLLRIRADEDSAFYYVNDSPVLRYLGVKPSSQIFKPVHYEADWLVSEVRRVEAEPGARARNRIRHSVGQSCVPPDTHRHAHALVAV